MRLLVLFAFLVSTAPAPKQAYTANGAVAAQPLHLRALGCISGTNIRPKVRGCGAAPPPKKPWGTRKRGGGPLSGILGTNIMHLGTSWDAKAGCKNC